MATTDRRPATPTEALGALIAGNQRFVEGSRIHPNQDAERRAELAIAQQPFAVVFGCADSRLAAEIIFDCGLGDLFVVRTAGQIIGAEVLASIEYGVTVLGVPLVVVLGHDSCGAIQATRDAMTGAAVPGPGLRPIVERIRPSVIAAHARHITDDRGIADIHLQRTAELILRSNTAIQAAVAQRRCALAGMSYGLAQGRVTVLSTEPADLAPVRAAT